MKIQIPMFVFEFRMSQVTWSDVIAGASWLDGGGSWENFINFKFHLTVLFSFVSIIRGRVLAEDGSPLTGVRIAEARHPPLTGFTLSRSEDNGGAFDLMVNGGRTVTLQFMRKPFEKLEKSFYVPWNEIVYVGDVKMRFGPVVSTAELEHVIFWTDVNILATVPPNLTTRKGLC